MKGQMVTVGLLLLYWTTFGTAELGISEGPSSQSANLGENATFTCHAATDETELLWTVSTAQGNVYFTVSDWDIDTLAQRGIYSVTISPQYSILIVLASTENNNVQVTCKSLGLFWVYSSGPVSLNVQVSQLHIETPLEILLGKPLTISCFSTSKDVTNITWVNAQTNEVLATVMSRIANITFSPLTMDMDAKQLMCLASGLHYSDQKIVTINITKNHVATAPTAKTPKIVNVPSEWSKVDIRSLAPVQPTPQKEHVYVMSCTVTVVAGLTTLPVVQWMREDGSPVSNPDIVVGPSVVSGQRISLLLMIGQLTVDNMGTYICRADISVPGHKGILPISTPVNITEKILQNSIPSSC